MLICSWCNNCTVALYSLGFFVSLWPHIYLFIAKIIFLENLYVQLLEQLCFLHYMCMYIFIYKYAIVTINDMRTCSVWLGALSINVALLSTLLANSTVLIYVTIMASWQHKFHSQQHRRYRLCRFNEDRHRYPVWITFLEHGCILLLVVSLNVFSLYSEWSMLNSWPDVSS